MWYDPLRPPERLFAETFLYLRTKLAIENCYEVIDALAAEWPYFVEYLSPFGDVDTWNDGLVLGLDTKLSPAEIAGQLRQPLSMFDAWAIHNAACEYTEWIDGPLSRYFARRPKATAQVFLRFNHDSPPENEIDRLRSLYDPEICVPVFHFRDGRILMIETSEPARTIYRRIEQTFRPPRKEWGWPQRFPFDFSGSDNRGNSFAPGEREIWQVTSVDDLFVEDGDDP